MTMRAACGRADLLRALACVEKPDVLPVMAELLGYEPPPPEKPVAAPLPPPITQTGTVEAEAPLATVGPEGLPLPETLFWRPETYEGIQGERPVDEAVVPAGPVEWRGRPAVDPDRHAPLAHWRTLLPRLRRTIAVATEGRALDAERIVRTLSRGERLSRLPRRRHLRWGSGLQIIIDRSDRLIPFWRDQVLVARQLERVFPRNAVQRGRFWEGLSEPVLFGHDGIPRSYRVPPPGTVVVVLGDLGCLATEPSELVRAWAAFGRRLRDAGCRPVALVPSAPERWASLPLASWKCLPWERPARAAAPSPAPVVDSVERLLRLVSPAIRIEPGFLRSVRRLLGSGGADAGCEADVWQHPAVVSKSSVAATLDPQAAERFRREFAALDRELQAAVLDRLRRWRADLPPEIWFEEVCSLDVTTQDSLACPADLEDVHQFFAAIARKPVTDGDCQWFRRFESRLPGHVRSSPDLRSALHRLWWQVHKDDPDPRPMPGFDPADIPVGGDRRSLEIRQGVDGLLVLARGSGSEPGSLISHLASRNGLIEVEPADLFWRAGRPPSWASDWGVDRFGPWVAFSVAGADGAHVVQRLRWCPPGAFQMGSPDDEPGRFGDEGPRQGVSIGAGFWMFETAVTQAVWVAVMGENPSRFRTPDRPVETVSWEDARAFIERINARVPGLDLRLPSEAEWEYACRAGTETALYSGAIEILGDANAPALDPIAWYAGNSGVGFELDEGDDLSQYYSDRQYKHDKSGTHPVKGKAPNAFGLYDMLGNVEEWCEDHWHDSYRGAPTDGRASLEADAEAGAPRVLRGGSWYDYARLVRSAYRNHYAPDDRNDFLGFRCARGQDGAEPRAEPRDSERSPAERGESAKAERPTGPAPQGGAALRRIGDDIRATLPIPAAPAFIVATDCERLTFGRIARADLPWARAVGRDRFGLWAEIRVHPERPEHGARPARQRLRWIPPGRFTMGSPEGEPGRYDQEGPQHEVTLANGYWLFDTPVTQALWTAVMGENPSRFRTPDRPVEQVSWNDVGNFFEIINERIEGLNLVLPSEAQWEYACRAGTDTALYTGPIEIVGDNNAPALHPIAWYGGNSGVDFELADGWDSSGWPDKQYDHQRAASRPVKRKAANPWGLYDMLGNVWEWCADAWHDSYQGAPTDGSAWLEAEAGAARVIRGGSWVDDARDVRSAVRSHYAPDARYGLLGFRCARVQEGAEPPAERSPIGRGAAAKAERPPAPDRPGAAQPKRPPWWRRFLGGASQDEE